MKEIKNGEFLKEKEYHISKKQLEELEYIKGVFSSQAENIKELCSAEREDIVYGYELGQIQSTIKTFELDFNDLIKQIKVQKSY